MTAGDQSAAPELRQDHAAKFLNFIFYGASRGFVEFRFPEGPKARRHASRPLYFGLPVNPQKAAQEALSVTSGMNVFVGLAPRYRVADANRPSTDRDVLRMRCKD
jgi:hypothetical protein